MQGMMAAAFESLRDFSEPIPIGAYKGKPKAYIFEVSEQYRVLLNNNDKKAVIKCPWHPDFGSITGVPPGLDLGNMKTFVTSGQVRRQTGWMLSHAAVGWFKGRSQFQYFAFVPKRESALNIAVQHIKQWADILKPYAGLIKLYGPGTCPTMKELRDARDRRWREVVYRPGAEKFRSDILEAYGGRCAVTGSSIKECLDAAHIVPHLGPETDVVTNGMCLRSDVHRLFGAPVKPLLWIDPTDYTIRLHPDLQGTSGTCDYREGERIHLPELLEERPDPDLLRCYLAI